MSLAPAAHPTRSYYTSATADLPEPVRWVHPTNASVGGPNAATLVKTVGSDSWSAGAVGARALAQSPGAFQGALSWRVPLGWHDHLFLGLAAADAPAADPDYRSHTLGLYLNVDAASGLLSLDAYQAGTPRYEGRLASPPVCWRPGAAVEVQVWRRAGGGFEGRFLLDDRCVFTLPLPTLAFPLNPLLSLHGPVGQAAGDLVLRGPRLVPSGYAQLPAGPLAWWRADAGLALDAGGALARWADQSGHGRDLLPDPAGPAPRPEPWAGGQALRWAGSPALVALDLGLPQAPTVLTSVQVLQLAPGATNVLPLAFGADAAHAHGLRVLFNYLGLSAGDDAIFGARRAAEALATGPVVLAAEWASAAPGRFRLWLNGRPLLVSALYATVAAHPLDGVLHLAGPAPGAGGSPWQGWLAETLLYDRALPDAAHAELADALAQRYALAPEAGLELLANSSFDLPAVPNYGPDWFAQYRWQVGSGQAVMQGGQGENGPDFLYQDTELEIGATYQVEFKIASYTSGTLAMQPYPGDGALPAAPYGVGVHRYTFVARQAAQRWHLVGSQNAQYALDYFSLRQAPPDAYHPAAGLPTAGLRLHLCPDRGLRATPDGHLAEWADQSPYALTLRPVDAGAPTPTVSTLAGGPAIFCDGNQSLVPLDLGGPAPAVLTAVLVLQVRPGVSSKMPIHFGQGANQDLWLDSNHFGLNTYGGDIRGITGAQARLEQPVVVVAEVHSSDPRHFRLWLNGVPQVLAQQQSNTSAYSLESIVRIGGYEQWRWQGWLGEQALYDRALTDTEQVQVYNSLRTRYPGLPAYVPAPALPAPTQEAQPPAATAVPAGPLAWYRAATGLTIDSLGTVVAWADRSGHGRNLTAGASYAAPTYGPWAGGQAVHFGGAQAFDLLDLDTAPAVLTAVLLLQAEGDSIMPIHFGQGNNQDLWLNANCFGLNTYGGDIRGIADAAARLARPVLVVAEVHSNDPGGFRLWLNGEAQAVAQQQGNTTPHTLESVVRVGGNEQWAWRGWIAEVLLYDRPLADAEQAQLAAYAQAHYTL